jgi:hypothetical protein
MTVDAADSLIRAVGAQDSSGYTVFSLRIRGRLNEELVTEHDLLLRGYTDGIHCSAFGHATVAVIGNTAEGKPIIVTDRGQLSLVDNTLVVGCADCARAFERATNQFVRGYRTPASDLSLVRSRPDSVRLAADGNLVVRHGGRWINISAPGPFRVAAEPPVSPPLRLEVEYSGCT